MARLRSKLPQAERAKLLADLALAPAWIRPHMVAVAQPDKPDAKNESE